MQTNQAERDIASHGDILASTIGLSATVDIILWYCIRYQILVSSIVKARHRTTLEAIYRHPVSGTIDWSVIEALLVALGAVIQERAGSRVAVILEGKVHVFHRPHPSPEADKGAVRDVRAMLREAGIEP